MEPLSICYIPFVKLNSYSKQEAQLILERGYIQKAIIEVKAEVTSRQVG